LSKTDIQEFREKRERLNEIVMKHAGTTIKRFWNLDTQAYAEGALPAKTKELLGLVVSFAMRCEDCVKYHLIRCNEVGITTEELTEGLAIGEIIGGSVTMPLLRRTYEAWEELQSSKGDDA
jgi:AhpD family alkylhydroperoxidase